MGTGIMSVALSLDGRRVVSRILLLITAAQWLLLCALLLRSALTDRTTVRGEASSPVALSMVAGTAVLGTRIAMLGWSAVAAVLLVLATLLWLALLVPVLRSWTTPTIGVSLLLAVSTESLAVLCASLAVPAHAAWLLPVALVPFLAGLGFYVFVIWTFELRQLAVGQGDHWITGGALAISTLAAARIFLAGRGLHELVGVGGVLKAASIALWILAIAWLPVLVAAELRWPRLAYHPGRWSTVFPLGMYAACSFLVGGVVSARAIGDFARVWVWIGVAIWALTFAATLSAAVRRRSEAAV